MSLSYRRVNIENVPLFQLTPATGVRYRPAAKKHLRNSIMRK